MAFHYRRLEWFGRRSGLRAAQAACVRGNRKHFTVLATSVGLCIFVRHSEQRAMSTLAVLRMPWTGLYEQTCRQLSTFVAHGHALKLILQAAAKLMV